MSAKQTSDLDLLLERTQALATTLRTTSQHVRKAAEQATETAKRAFVLAAPYAELVAKGEATLIVKSQAFKVDGEELFLADSDRLYGSIVLAKAKPISLAEFRRRAKEHRIPDEERKAMWPRSRRLYAFSVEKVAVFATPRPWQSAEPAPAPQLRFKREAKDEELAGIQDADKQLAASVVMYSNLFDRQIGPVVDQAMRLMDLPGSTRSMLSTLKSRGNALELEYAKLLARLGLKKGAGEADQVNVFVTADKLSALLKRATGFLPKKTRISALTEDAIEQLEALVKLEAQFKSGVAVAAEIGKAEVDGLYEVDASGNFVDLTADDLIFEQEDGAEPLGKLPVLKTPDPRYVMKRFQEKLPTGILTHTLRKGRVGQEQFLVDEHAVGLNAACIWGIVTLEDPEELEAVTKLADPAAIDPGLLDEFDDDDPACFQEMKLVTAFDPPLLLKQAPLGVRFGPAIELPGALAKVKKAVWTTAYINSLPDSAFLHIAPGGKKDEDGKTVPRSLRFFPVRNDKGEIDLPHLRNALARIPQSNLSQATKDAAAKKAKKLLAEAKEEAAKKGLNTVTTGDVPLMHPLQRPAVPGSTDGITATGSFCYCPACGEVMELKEGESCKDKVCPSCPNNVAMRAMDETSQKELDRLRKESGKEAYVCPKCGYKTTFDPTRKGSGRVCPKCGTQMVREQKSLAKQDDKPWMSFRGMSPDSLKELSDGDLKELYQLAQDLLKGPLAEATTMNGLSREDVENALAFIKLELQRRGLTTEAAKAGPSDHHAPVRPGSEGDQECLKLEQLLPHFRKEFLLQAPMVHLVGSVVNTGETENDIDILVKGPMDPATAHVIKMRLGRMLPPEISRRCEFHGGEEDVSKARPMSAYVPLYDLVMRRSAAFETIVEMRDAGLEPMFLSKEEELTRQDPFLQLPGREGSTQSVLHLHFRGRTVRADFRVKTASHLIGYTMAIQVAGRVPLMGSLEEARRFVGGFDIKGSRWNKALVAPARLHAATKAPEPLSWLRIKSEEFEPGSVGATRYNKGYVVAIANPQVSYGERTPVYHEYFLEKDPKLQGLLSFRMLAGQGGGEAKAEGQDGGTPEGQSFWVAMLAKNLLPSVVRRRAVNVGRIPPQGWSFLPPKLKAVVPKRFRYWLPSDEKARMEMRNALVEEGFFTESNVKIVDGEFRRVMTKYFLYEPPEEDRCDPEESQVEAKGGPNDLVDHLRIQTEALTKAVQDLKIERLAKARHRSDTCMQCKAAVTHEVVWAGYRARAWFCSKHFHSFKGNKANEVTKWRRIEGGKVGQKYGDAPLDKTGKQPAYWDPHSPNPKVREQARKPPYKKPQVKKVDDDVVTALAKGFNKKPNAIVTVACQGDMAKALVAMLETIKAHCNWGASRSWSIDDEQIAKELKAKGYATVVGFDGDGADKIVDIKLTPVLAKALHTELVAKGAGRSSFTLAGQRWKSQVMIQETPSRQVFHLYIKRPDGVEDFQILADPSKVRKAAVIHRTVKGSKVKELMTFEGKAPPKKKVGGVVINPNNVASTVSILTRGFIFFTQDDATVKKFKLGGLKMPPGLKGMWTLKKEKGAKDTWVLTKSGAAPAKKDAGDTSPSVPCPPTAIQDAQCERVCQEKKLNPSQQRDYDKETAQIQENRKKPAAQRRHKFKGARWTHPNGHPRCLICGDEERTGGMCEGRKKTEKGYFETHTTEEHGHSHHAFVDEYTGNGITGENALDQAGSGHAHDIIHWQVQPVEDGHTHNIGLIAGVKKGVFETHTTEDQGHSHHVFVDEFTGHGVTETVEGHAHPVAYWRVQSMGHTHSIGLIQGVEKDETAKGHAEVHTGDYEGHSHRAYVDEYTGDGETAEDFGHKHMIEKWHVLGADSRDFGRHTHTMGILPGKPGGPPATDDTVTSKEASMLVKFQAIRRLRGVIWDRHEVEDSSGVYNFCYAVGPVAKDEAGNWAETTAVKGEIYVKAGRTRNAKLAADVGDVIHVEVAGILYDASNLEKRKIQGFTPTVIDKTTEGPSSIKEVMGLFEGGEANETAGELQDAIAKSVGLGDWGFIAKQQKEDERYVLGVVLIPNEYDSQGDIYDDDTVRKASEYFMEHAKTLGLMHETALTEKKVKILENYIAPCDLTIEGQRVKKGTWLLAARVLDDALWTAVKEGNLTGWSIEGSALAQFVDSTN